MSEKTSILVVDDEIGPRESLRVVLKPDYRVLLATEGADAIRLVERERVDVVLLDLRMPGSSGLQVLRTIKDIDPSIEVIVVTGYASYDTVLEGLRLHAFDYVPKPFSVPQLRDTVRRAVHHRERQRMAVWGYGAGRSAPLAWDDLGGSLETITETSQRLLEDFADALPAHGIELLLKLQTAGRTIAAFVDSLPISANGGKPPFTNGATVNKRGRGKA